MKYGYKNGKIKKMKDILISPYDLGFLRGYAIFDVSRTTKDGKIFLLEEHYKRIKNSTKELSIKFNLSKEEFKDIVKKLLLKNNLKEAIIRVIITGGKSSDGFDFKDNSTVLILIEKIKLPNKNILEQGVNLVSLEYSRNYSKIKHTNYIEAIKNQSLKKKFKAFEILYIKNKIVFECSTANIFIIKKNIIYTPKDGILFGITRQLVIDLIKKNNFKIKEKVIKEKELYSADEVFITATNKNILPVVKINNKKINNKLVGENTKKLISLFKEFENNY